MCQYEWSLVDWSDLTVEMLICNSNESRIYWKSDANHHGKDESGIFMGFFESSNFNSQWFPKHVCCFLHLWNVSLPFVLQTPTRIGSYHSYPLSQNLRVHRAESMALQKQNLVVDHHFIISHYRVFLTFRHPNKYHIVGSWWLFFLSPAFMVSLMVESPMLIVASLFLMIKPHWIPISDAKNLASMHRSRRYAERAERWTLQPPALQAPVEPPSRYSPGATWAVRWCPNGGKILKWWWKLMGYDMGHGIFWNII